MLAKKTDKNQKEIIAYLRSLGATVFCASSIGKGFPDLLVGYKERNILIEVKNPEKSSLTPDQVEFISKWKGEKIYIVKTKKDIDDIITGCS